MGLDIDCKCETISFRAGSYSGFGYFREKLAEASGFDLNQMEGFHHDKDYGELSGSKPWTGQEPFYEILDHSDCDGVLTPKQCAKLLSDFEKYAEGFKKLPLEAQSWYVDRYNLWIDAIKHSTEKCCTLRFG